jgi:Tc5 transposase DNA-binding domain
LFLITYNTNNNSGGLSRKEAHNHEQLMSASQEEVLVEWIKVQGRRGVPITHTTLAQYAREIANAPVGKTWSKRFLRRHPDLKVKMTVALEKARAKALNRTAVNGFYDMLEKLIEEYNILPGNIYNMDEKGIQLGIGARVAALIDHDQKLAYSIEDGNRELVTIIETVCADGSTIHPSAIFQGVRRNSNWGRNNPCNARLVLMLSGTFETLSTIGLQYISFTKWLDRSRARSSMA